MNAIERGDEVVIGSVNGSGGVDDGEAGCC